jgi:hypothetical protein
VHIGAGTVCLSRNVIAVYVGGNSSLTPVTPPLQAAIKDNANTQKIRRPGRDNLMETPLNEKSEAFLPRFILIEKG